MPSGSRLVASRCTRGQRRMIASAALAQPPIRCSQLSTTISTSCGARASSSASSAPARPGGQPQRLADGRRHPILVGDRGQLRQPHPVPGPIQQLGSHLQAQPGLAAPAGPGQGDQPRRFHQGPDLGDLPLAADERRQLGREVARPGEQRVVRRQHTRRRGMPARRRLEQRPPRPGQAQRIGQQPGRVLAGGQVDPPLQVTDRPRGNARRLRQLLLRQPSIGPQLPQQPPEPRRSLLRHGPHRPFTSPGPQPAPGAARLPARARQQVYKPAASSPGTSMTQLTAPAPGARPQTERASRRRHPGGIQHSLRLRPSSRDPGWRHRRQRSKAARSCGSPVGRPVW